MIRTEKSIKLSTNFDISMIAPPEDIMFFDIETTGLSVWKSGLYLIGLLTYDDGWKLIQYFCEDVSDESIVLENFFTLLSSKKVLVSFNGDGFDIPFLTHMVEQYELPYSFDNVSSFDIFKKIRPLKKLLELPNLKLKTCEKFLGIYREDKFTGGDLIYVYFDWQRDHDPDKLNSLLLHNAEDIENLPNVLPILNYIYALKGDFCLKSHEIVDLRMSQNKVLSLLYDCMQPDTDTTIKVPHSVDIEIDGWTLNMEESSINLCTDLYSGELKYFYPDYKDYYYLPFEDKAIHKSVAEFVDPKFRKKATAKTCYQKLNGIFVPEVDPVFSPTLSKEYKDKIFYAKYEDNMFDDQKASASYLASVIKKLKL